MRRITKELIWNYRDCLIEEEKTPATLEKYLRDITAFTVWCGKKELTKELVLEYKRKLILKYAPASVNSAISSLNSFFSYNEWYDLKIKSVKVQKQMFINADKTLTKPEYEKLLTAAKKNNKQRLYYLMQTICSTGIRVSELRFITVDSVNRGQTTINSKGKTRIVFLPKALCRMLKDYVKANSIKKGSVFVSKNGKPLDRSNIWSDMKKLCETAGISKSKVFPHNLRHLFARTYYSVQKDIVRLADILGHSSVNTTRIYTIETGEIHRRQIQKLGLLLC